mmetsp:Transcript_247/g.242  ORF Transcript_247/g.242 Transcript_247/m.242 type:complete len:102 (+) Transcript_247:2-307(+)
MGSMSNLENEQIKFTELATEQSDSSSPFNLGNPGEKSSGDLQPEEVKFDKQPAGEEIEGDVDENCTNHCIQRYFEMAFDVNRKFNFEREKINSLKKSIGAK